MTEIKNAPNETKNETRNFSKENFEEFINNLSAEDKVNLGLNGQEKTKKEILIRIQRTLINENLLSEKENTQKDGTPKGILNKETIHALERWQTIKQTQDDLEKIESAFIDINKSKELNQNGIYFLKNYLSPIDRKIIWGEENFSKDINEKGGKRKKGLLRIVELQKFLNENYLSSQNKELLVLDGLAGPKTKTALKEWKKTEDFARRVSELTPAKIVQTEIPFLKKESAELKPIIKIPRESLMNDEEIIKESDKILGNIFDRMESLEEVVVDGKKYLEKNKEKYETADQKIETLKKEKETAPEEGFPREEYTQTKESYEREIASLYEFKEGYEALKKLIPEAEQRIAQNLSQKQKIDPPQENETNPA